jgi:hypothetical protein
MIIQILIKIFSLKKIHHIHSVTIAVKYKRWRMGLSLRVRLHLLLRRVCPNLLSFASLLINLTKGSGRCKTLTWRNGPERRKVTQVILLNTSLRTCIMYYNVNANRHRTRPNFCDVIILPRWQQHRHHPISLKRKCPNLTKDSD